MPAPNFKWFFVRTGQNRKRPAAAVYDYVLLNPPKELSLKLNFRDSIEQFQKGHNSLKL